MMNASVTKSVQSQGSCVFCECLKGSGEYVALEKNRLTATFIAQNQQGNPHLLVIPISHKKTLHDLTEKEAEALIRAVKDASNTINLAYQGQDISIWQNSQEGSIHSINHIHFNVAGRSNNDVFYQKNITNDGANQIQFEINRKLRGIGSKPGFLEKCYLYFDTWFVRQSKKFFDSLLAKHMFRSWVNMLLWSFIYLILVFLPLLGIHLSRNEGGLHETLILPSFLDKFLLYLVASSALMIIFILHIARKRGDDWDKVKEMLVDEVYGLIITFSSIIFINGFLVLKSPPWVMASMTLSLLGYLALILAEKI